MLLRIEDERDRAALDAILVAITLFLVEVETLRSATREEPQTVPASEVRPQKEGRPCLRLIPGWQES